MKLERAKEITGKESVVKSSSRPTSPFGEALDVGFATGFGSTLGGIQQLLGGDKERLREEAIKRENRYQAIEEKSKLGAIIGNILGGAVSTAPLAAIPGVGVAASPLGRAALTAGRGGAEAAAAGALQYTPEEQSRLKNAAISGLLGGGASGTMGGAAELYNAFKPTKLFRGQLSPEELLANQAAAAQSEIPLGEIINNSFLKQQHENILMNMPSSGAREAAARTSADINKEAGDLLREMTGHDAGMAGDIGINLQKGIRDVDQTLQRMSSENYRLQGEEATKLGIEVLDENFPEEAKRFLKEIDADPKLKADFPKDQYKKLEEYAGFSGNKSTFNNEILFRSSIGDKLREATINRDQNGKRIYGSLLKSIDKDIDNAIKDFPDFAQKYKENHKFYQEEIVPLQDKLIKGYAHGGKDTDSIIAAFLKPAKKGQEQKNTLKKITDVLGKSNESENLMNTLRYGVFSGAIEGNKVNPNAMEKIFNNLGPEQRKLLFQDMPSEIEKLQNFSLKNEMNKGSIRAMANLGTGRDLWAALGYALPAAGAYTGYQGGEATGIPLAATIGGGLGLLAGAGIGPGKRLTNLMTSPQYRNKFIDNMLAEELKKPSKHKKSVEAGRILGALSGQADEEEIKPYRIDITKAAKEEE